MVISLVLTFVVFLLLAPQFLIFTLCFTPMRHVSQSLIIALIFSFSTLYFAATAFISLIVLLALLSYTFVFSIFPSLTSSFILLFPCSNYNCHIFFFFNPYCFLSLFHISEVSYFFFYCICISFCCNVIHKDGQTYFYIHNLIFLTNLIYVTLFSSSYYFLTILICVLHCPSSCSQFQ